MFRKFTYLYHQTDDPDDARQQIVASAKSNTSAQRNVWLRSVLWLLAFVLWVAANVAANSYEAANGPIIPGDSPMVWVSSLIDFVPPLAASLFVPEDFRRDRAYLTYRNSFMDLSLFADESDDFFVDYVNYMSHVESGTPYCARSRLDAEQVSRGFREVVDQYEAALMKRIKRLIVVPFAAMLLAVLLVDLQFNTPEYSPIFGARQLLLDVSLIVNPYYILALVAINTMMRAANAARACRMLKETRERADQGGYATVLLHTVTLRYQLTGFI